MGHCASVGTGDRFATGVLAGFDVVQCQVAYVSGSDARLTEVASDATRDAIRSGELRLTKCAFEADNVQRTLHQILRIHKYVERGFRLPAGPLSAAPLALRDGAPSTALNKALLCLLKGRLHWEPRTPPRTTTPAPFPLLLKFARVGKGAWRMVSPRSAAQQQQPMDGLSPRLRSHPEALAVWTFVMKQKAVVERTRQDTRACVPQYNGWRVLGRLRRSGKGIDRFDLYLFPPDVLPGRPLHLLRPTLQAVRSFRGLHSLLMQRFATTALGGGGGAAEVAARSNGRCPACCTLPCCQHASTSVGRAAPPLPPAKRYRVWQCAGGRASASDDTSARPPTDGGPIEVTGMWENVVRVNGIVREDLETAITRHTHVCEEEREYGRARRLITDETEERAATGDKPPAPSEEGAVADEELRERFIELDEDGSAYVDTGECLRLSLGATPHERPSLPIRICGEEEEATDIGLVAGEEQSW